MSTTTDLIDQFAHRHGLENDLQTAKKLRLGTGTVYRYRRGSTMDDDLALKLCKDLSLDPAPVLANLVADRQINQTTAREWRKIAQRLGTTAAGIFLLALSPIGELLQHFVYYVKS